MNWLKFFHGLLIPQEPGLTAQSKSRLLEVLAKLKPLKEEFSDVDEGVMNPHDNPF